MGLLPADGRLPGCLYVPGCERPARRDLPSDRRSGRAQQQLRLQVGRTTPLREQRGTVLRLGKRIRRDFVGTAPSLRRKSIDFISKELLHMIASVHY